MNKFYQILRLTGYVSGLTGLALYMFARGEGGEAGLWTRVAAGLLVLMFVSMMMSYFLYAAIQMKRKNR